MQTLDRLPRGQLAEDDSEGMSPFESLAAVRDDQQCRDRIEPAGNQPQHVQRRLVGPVHVLEHEDRGHAPAELLDDSRCNLVGDRTAEHEIAEFRPCRLRDVEDRPQWPWGEQRVAGTPEEPRSVPMPLAEMADESCLSCTGFTLDEHESPVTCERMLVGGLEPGEERLPLQQVALRLEDGGHTYILPPLPPVLKLRGRYDRGEVGGEGV